jgi:hypothetical protein
MTPRETALRNIAVGDIFHAGATNGASLLCLAMAVTETTIQARNVATQIVYVFDRRSGIADWLVGGKSYECAIDSVAPLPSDIREILLGLDRKGREAEYRAIEDPDRPWPSEETRLTKDQLRALLFVADFYPANPLPALT